MIKLLIVEDEPLIREGIATQFDWASLDVVVAGCAKDGIEGLEMARALRPDAILCDIVMPRMNGFEMMEQLRAEGWSGEAIILSAHEDVTYLKRAFKYQAFDYLFKPFENQEMRLVVQKMVDSIKRQRSRTVSPAHDSTESPIDNKTIQETIDMRDGNAHPQTAFMDRLTNRVHDDLALASIDTLAEAMDLSRATLIRVVKKITNKTVSEFILQQRITEACSQLIKTDMRVYEIAQCVGYKDVRYFSQLFIQEMGMQPSEYRKRYGRR